MRLGFRRIVILEYRHIRSGSSILLRINRAFHAENRIRILHHNGQRPDASIILVAVHFIVDLSDLKPVGSRLFKADRSKCRGSASVHLHRGISRENGSLRIIRPCCHLEAEGIPLSIRKFSGHRFSYLRRIFCGSYLVFVGKCCFILLLFCSTLFRITGLRHSQNAVFIFHCYFQRPGRIVVGISRYAIILFCNRKDIGSGFGKGNCLKGCSLCPFHLRFKRIRAFQRSSLRIICIRRQRKVEKRIC